MSIIIKTEREIEILREGGKHLASVLYQTAKIVKPGISTKELDDYAKNLIISLGDKPAFLNYKPDGARKPYPASLCVSINNEIVHGIPGANRILKEGDIVSLDLGLNHKGLFTDMAVTVPVGKVDKKYQKLIDVTQQALEEGIKACVCGNRIGDIGFAIEKFIKPNKFGIVRILSGHGVGKKVHEEPYIPNFGKKGTGEKLISGMVIALEPMLNEGTFNVYLDKDGWTYKTADGKRSAHFEHTILITDREPEILTKL